MAVVGPGPVLLGVDAGGTSTVLALAASAGARHVVRLPSGANPTTVDPGEALAILRDGVGRILAEAGLPASAVDAAVVGVAGVDRPAARAPVAAWLAATFPDRPTRVVTDVEVALRAGTAGGVGIAIVAGTGSIVLGRDRAGSTARSGGWGPAIGDPGSGHAIGLAALRAVVRAADGRAAPTLLTARLLAVTGVARVHDLPGVATRGPTEVAALAPLVAAAAGAGDATADAILERAAIDLAGLVEPVLARLSWDGPIACALAGGVVRHIEPLRTTLLRRLARCYPELAPPTVVDDPVAGALALARDLWMARAR